MHQVPHEKEIYLPAQTRDIPQFLPQCSRHIHHINEKLRDINIHNAINQWKIICIIKPISDHLSLQITLQTQNIILQTWKFTGHIPNLKQMDGL
jgi:hypothetical protein